MSEAIDLAILKGDLPLVNDGEEPKPGWLIMGLLPGTRDFTVQASGWTV